MAEYVEIAVNVPQVRGVFHYHLPPELEGRLAPGHLVVVPFGRQFVQGVVLRPVAQPSVAETKAVESLLDDRPVLTPAQIALAEHISAQNLALLAACLDLMLPPGLSQRSETSYSLAQPAPTFDPGAMTPLQNRLLKTLGERGPLRASQMERLFSRQNWQKAARELLRWGLVEAQTELRPPQVSPRSVRTASLACSPAQAQAAMPGLAKQGSATLERLQKMLAYLLAEPGAVEVSWLYAESGGTLADLRRLEEQGLITLGESEVWRDPLDDVIPYPASPPALTAEQAQVWQRVQAAIQGAAGGQVPAPLLLHGVTGSGKTEIYLRAVQETLALGRQAIVLVPEIALTPQTVRRFVDRFPGQVGLVHSRLSAGERYDTWRRARLGLLPIIVGPRSALFTPLPGLGLIILDECHDDSYYQDDFYPTYDARQAALAYARLAGALCLQGSATPDVSAYYQAQSGDWQLLELPQRILAHRQVVQAHARRLGGEPRYQPLEGDAESIALPPVQVVDMREELKGGNRSIFSRSLQQALAQVVERGQQAILFLNRRGSSTYVFCRDCGTALKCPRCETPLTLHGSSSSLLCHRCNYRRQMPKTCSQCGSARIRQFGTGTERVESEVEALLPGARLLRWDYETTRKKGAHEFILHHFASHQADILIGTQMLAKGLDLPLVTLVGVVLADVGLNLPDYRAGERVFQVLTQVAGRAGRSPLGGQVILQSFMPEHYAIQAAAKHDFSAFYQQELVYRRRLGYPPFARLARLEYRSPNAQQAEKAAQTLARQLQHKIEQTGKRASELIGPAPCFFAKVDGNYRWQIVLRSPDPVALLRDEPLGDWRLEIDPPSLL